MAMPRRSKPKFSGRDMAEEIVRGASRRAGWPTALRFADKRPTDARGTVAANGVPASRQGRRDHAGQGSDD